MSNSKFWKLQHMCVRALCVCACAHGCGCAALFWLCVFESVCVQWGLQYTRDSDTHIFSQMSLSHGRLLPFSEETQRYCSALPCVAVCCSVYISLPCVSLLHSIHIYAFNYMLSVGLNDIHTVCRSRYIHVLCRSRWNVCVLYIHLLLHVCTL